MVCEKCEKKLTKVIVPDKWKAGASNTTEGGGRKINENKLLSKKNRWTPYGNTKCMICKQQVHQEAKYCHTCAYTKGVCAMCGKQVLDTKLYKQSSDIFLAISACSLLLSWRKQVR
ncbi:cysteine-rich PDZ-binding protein [Quillaja saponaria]|uniref:Cysteine-rich PDZ-binding protein n=1 Tax=Quillaja saponaria TaxID=32244 RepID=A0AAD7M0E2_QUISA|nr:cysteine-rich PDZ-binding protein [Quillaja saponaria]